MAGDDPRTDTQARVLLVDDDPEFVALVRGFLIALGYRVESALHGADALMAMRLIRPDAVLLDIKMTGMHGLEVLRRMQALYPTIPVIMVTADDDPALIRETRELGAYSYVIKPVEASQLKRVLNKALEPVGPPRRTAPYVSPPPTRRDIH